MRKLATVEVISEIRPHTNADALEIAIVRGWQVVVRKGEFVQGQTVVYFEIDSWIPTEIAPFLSKGAEPREYEGIKGERLRTIKLRGEISCGMILPITVLERFGKLIYENGIPTSLVINKMKLINCEEGKNGDLSDLEQHQ